MDVERSCVVCSTGFLVKEHQIKRGRGKCCSLSCAATLASANRDQSGPSNNNWKGGSDNTGRKRRYRASNPQKHAAHLAVRNAIRSGELTRNPCEVCGKEKSEAHHSDYSKPLDVEWLCKKHHLLAHKGRFGKPVSSPATFTKPTDGNSELLWLAVVIRGGIGSRWLSVKWRTKPRVRRQPKGAEQVSRRP